MSQSGFLGTPHIQYFVDSRMFSNGGQLYTYEPGTTTPKAAYSNIADKLAKTNALTNPIILDNLGQALVVLDGLTRLVYYAPGDVAGVDSPIWDVDNFGESAITDILDVNGKPILKFYSVSDAEVWVIMKNNFSGFPAMIMAGGTNESEDINLLAKGAASLQFKSDLTTIKMPITYGTDGQYAKTDANGQLSWATFPSVTPPPLYSPPIGSIEMYGGSTPPSASYMFCDGSAISRTTYSALFTLIGTTYGAGDGSTTFNIPNFSRRIAVGRGGTGTGTLGNAVGNTGGTEDVTLVTANLPAHTHSYVRTPLNGVIQEIFTFVTNTLFGTLSTISTGSTGSGAAHNNMQPSLVVEFTIKVL